MFPTQLIAAGLLLARISNALETCYYPDGTTISDHVPCNQTSSGVSSCCDPKDSCSESGFCLGRSGWIYRGSCTDASWASANCAKQFPACVTDPSSQQRYDFWTPLWSCDAQGTAVSNFCCGYGSGDTCCQSQFTLGTTGNAFKPGEDALVQNISSAAIASYTATAATSSPTGETSQPSSSSSSSSSSNSNSNSNSNSDLGTKIGLGVGVPLGVLALGLLALLFWREKRKRAPEGGDSALMMSQNSGSNQGSNQTYTDQSHGHGQVNNYPQGGTYIEEQHKSAWSPAPTYEAPANTAPQELRA